MGETPAYDGPPPTWASARGIPQPSASDPPPLHPAPLAPSVGGAETLGPGAMLGPYRIEGVLGEGCMGRVYRARHTNGGAVALKVLWSEAAAHEEVRKRFVREAQVAGAIHHPAVIELYDFVDDGALCYLAMELVEGRPLSAITPRSGLPAARVGILFDQLLEALAAAHKAGVVHRDLKPSNVLVVPGDGVKLVDFGIASVLQTASADLGPALTTPGTFIGTPTYAAPEQVQGERVDERTDLYSTGVMLYETLCGRTPFVSDSVDGYMRAHVRDAPPPIARFRPGQSKNPALELVLQRALAKKPGDRFQTALEMRARLREALGGIAATSAAPATRKSPPGIGNTRVSPPALALHDVPPTDRIVVKPATSPPPEQLGRVVEPPVEPKAEAKPNRGARAMGVLLTDETPTAHKYFLFAGSRLTYGRMPADGEGNPVDVILRALPCRSAELDPQAWAATLRISKKHGEVAFGAIGATVIDQSSLGTTLNRSPIERDKLTSLPDAFQLSLGEEAIVLAGRVTRKMTITPATLGGDTMRIGDGGEGPVAGICLYRTTERPQHAYLLARDEFTVGSSDEALLELTGFGLLPLHARLAVEGDTIHVQPATGGAVVTVNGRPVPHPHGATLAHGACLGLGPYELQYRAIEERDFTSL